MFESNRNLSRKIRTHAAREFLRHRQNHACRFRATPVEKFMQEYGGKARMANGDAIESMARRANAAMPQVGLGTDITVSVAGSPEGVQISSLAAGRVFQPDDSQRSTQTT